MKVLGDSFSGYLHEQLPTDRLGKYYGKHIYPLHSLFREIFSPSLHIIYVN